MSVTILCEIERLFYVFILLYDPFIVALEYFFYINIAWNCIANICFDACEAAFHGSKVLYK